jgi:hypothetical protein
LKGLTTFILIRNDPIITKIIAYIPFFDIGSFKIYLEERPTKIGVVIVKVATKYAGRYVYDCI